MGEVFSPAAVRQQYVEAMGPDLGRLFHTLMKEVVILHGTWEQFRILYAKSLERVELLNKTAGFFFYLNQHVLWEHVVLHIARLLERKGNRHQDNLSLEQLAGYIEDAEARSEFDRLLQVARDKAEFTRIWRNKRLAHRDLDHALDKHAHSLPSATREQVGEVLQAIADVMNLLELHYRKHYCHFEMTTGPLDDAETLVRYIKAGYLVEQERLRRIANADPLPSYLKPTEV